LFARQFLVFNNPLAVQKITIEDFLSLAKQHPVLDVRSPGEYNHAHIPGAFSFPLFSDEERKQVGTAYKQQSREEAIKIGLDYFGVNMKKMVEKAETIAASHRPSPTKTLLVHCWRGGMRSAAVAWLLDLYGFKLYTLAGGYKTFRTWALEQFEKNYPFAVLGGYTGSGKTYVLQELVKQKETVIDFEGIANHKGSAFGNIGMPAQPGQEQFENNLATELLRAETTGKPIWVEDESQRIGTVNIPINLWKNMRKRPLYFLDIDFEERLQHIVTEYGRLEKEKLVNAIIRIKKRLGGLETREAINALLDDRTEDCFRILLTYYDKWYLKGMHNREGFEALLHKIPCKTVSPSNMGQLLQSI
jgi:tRNA 2-selenouridine synthase